MADLGNRLWLFAFAGLSVAWGLVMNWGLQRASEIQRYQYQLGFTRVPVYCVALTRMFCLGVAGPLVFAWVARATTAERGAHTQAAQQRAAADEARMTLSDLRSALANGTALRS